MTQQADLAALLGSRICHDLISPIGAISNGVELMMMAGGAPSPELALIAESVSSANARIRFFRVAFGQSGTEQRIGHSEISKILADVYHDGRINATWHLTDDVLRREARLAFLAILCCESALAYGGRIHIRQDAGRWCVTAQAERLRIETNVWDALAKSRSDISPSQVHFALLQAALTEQNRRLHTEMSETEIKLIF